MGEVNIEVYIHFLINMTLYFVKPALILLNRMALRKGSTDISSKQVLLYLLKLVFPLPIVTEAFSAAVHLISRLLSPLLQHRSPFEAI